MQGDKVVNIFILPFGKINIYQAGKMTMTAEKTQTKRGPPAAFDDEIALRQAMYAFWEYGYEGTSMRILMALMQINKASIYAAYGSKEALFKKTVEKYLQGPASFLAETLQ